MSGVQRFSAWHFKGQGDAAVRGEAGFGKGKLYAIGDKAIMDYAAAG